MAAFLDACRFNPTLGGTTDWTYSSAVTGYNSPALAGVVNARVYKYRAEDSTNTQWEMGEGSYNTSTGVLTRTTVLFNSSGTGTASGQSGAGTKISFSTVPQVAIVALKEDLLAIEEANAFTATQRGRARTNISVPFRGALAGLTMSVTGVTSTFVVNDGEAADSTNSDLIVLSGTNKTTGAWAVGAASGALDTGSIANNTWYAVFIIKRPDTGVTDVLISLSATAPTLPANYTIFRRIGWIRVASSVLKPFVQIGDKFYWTTPVQDASVLTVGTSRTLLTLTCPPSTIAFLRSLGYLVSGVTSFIIQPTAEADQVPGIGGYVIASEVANGGTGAPFECPVDGSSQLAVRAAVASSLLQLFTWGWEDYRGRLS